MVLEVYRDRQEGPVLMGRFEGDTTKGATLCACIRRTSARLYISRRH